MALKDFNFKQFMLQKGEWVGLGVALAITLPVFLFGMYMILRSGSPTSNALDLDRLTKDADQRISSASPPADAAEPPKEFFTVVTYARVDPNEYTTPTYWFVQSSLEDTRRRSPDVLSPADFHVDVVRGGMKGYILDGTNKRVMVLQDKQVVLGRDRKSKKNVKLGNRMSRAGSMGRGMGGMPGASGGEYGGSGDAGPGMPGMPGMSPAGVQTPDGTIPSTSWQDVEKVGTGQNVRLAETIYPVRMAVVTGTFPFRQQMDEFRRALKKRNLSELFAMFNNNEASWQFLGFDIERRVLYPDGREKTPWKDYGETLKSEFLRRFAVAVDYEKDDPEFHKYEGILNEGLAMVRLQLERGQYPKVELQGIKDTIAALDKQSQGEETKRPLSDLARQFQKKGLDVFNPFNPFLADEEEEANKPTQEKPNQPPGSSEKKSDKPDTDEDADLLVPDKALVRFIDVTIEPGLVYEYRIKVKMANPNYKQKNLAYAGLADKKEIKATDWTVIPKVVVPHDIYYYAMDEKPDRDKANMQIHRWVDFLLKDPLNANTRTPVGDWSIAEKLPVHRGEYVGRLFETKVPLWNIQKEDFELAVNPKNKQDRKLPVDFTVRTSKALDPALLVDYQGRKDAQERVEMRTPENRVKQSLVTDDVPVQVLILTPEGKLVVRSYQEDNSNEERVARHKAWKDWIAEVESGRRKAGKVTDQLFDKFRGGGGSN